MAVKAAIKRGITQQELAEVIASVANAGGGELLYYSTPNDAEKAVSEAVKLVSPSIMPVIIPVNDNAIIAVPDGAFKPYMFAGKFPVYRNGRIEHLTVNEVERMFMERWATPSYDARLLDNLSVDALNLELVEQFASKMGDRWPLKLLEKLGLTHGGKPTVAAMLMFGAMPEAYIPQSEIKVNRTKSFSDSEKLTSKSFLGPILEKFDRILGYVADEARQVFEKEKFQCVEEMLREVLGNAIMHRDYSLPALTEISISIEGISIFSPGVPPTGRYPAENGYVPSMPRNPLLRRVMYFAGIVQPSPGWAMLRQKAQHCGLDGIQMAVQWGGLFISLPIGRKIVKLDRLNPRQQELYRYLTRHKVITRKEYEQMMGISERTARLDLEEMVKSGILKREGRGKQIRYVLNQ